MNVTSYPGGIVRGSRGMIPKTLDFDRLGLIPQQTLFDLVVRPLLGDANGDAAEGFWGDSFVLTLVTGKTQQVQPGIAWQAVAEAAEGPSYKPIVATDPFDVTPDDTSDDDEDRIDILSIRAAQVDEDEYRDVVDLDGGGTMTPTEVTVLSRPGVDWILTKGVQGVSPSAPAVPSGYLAVAQLLVHGYNNGNNVVVTDLRNQLARLGEVARRVRHFGGSEIVTWDQWDAAGSVITGRGVGSGSGGGKQALKNNLTAGNGMSFYAPLKQLKHGAPLQLLTVRINRYVAGGTLSVTVIQTLADGTVNVLYVLDLSAETDTGDQTYTLPMSHTVDLNAGSYGVTANITDPVSDGDLQIYSAEVSW